MKKSYLLAFLKLILLSNLIYGQTPQMIEDVYPGPLLCGLRMAVITGNNFNFSEGRSFSCGTPHNSGWFNFYADSSYLEFSYTSNNCLQNEGLQFILFDESGNEISCRGNQLSGIFAATVIPCERYYMMIDGFNGDQCDFFMIPTRGIDIANDTIPNLGGKCEILGPTSGPPCNAPSRAT